MSIPSIEEARSAAKSKDLAKAEQIYKELIAYDNSESLIKNENLIQIKESCILELAQLYQQNNQLDTLIDLLTNSRNNMSTSSFAKSKITKIIKTLIDLIEKYPADNSTSSSTILLKTIDATKESIDWAVSEKRIFLRQALQLKLGNLYYKNLKFNDSIEVLNLLIKEFKKLDDKLSLVELQLLESKNYFALKNYPKARSSITSARTSASSIYCSSYLQAELDLMSGILNCQDKDFITGYSYFYESMENYLLNDTETTNNSINSNEINSKIVKVIKYMILCKIATNSIDDINNNILNKKQISKYINNKQIESMKLIAKSYQDNSLIEFEKTLKLYANELTNDSIVKTHLNDLYEKLFEKNLLKLIKPYSCIEISYLSSLIGLSNLLIENKLSNMILDNVINGVLDQNNGWLVIYDEDQNSNDNYSVSLDLIKNMSSVVDLLYEKASLLN